jgi:hypothetical protein
MFPAYPTKVRGQIKAALVLPSLKPCDAVAAISLVVPMAPSGFQPRRSGGDCLIIGNGDIGRATGLTAQQD